MNISQARNIGAYVATLLAFNYLQVVAGGAADGVGQNGRAVDRKNYLSCVAQVLVSATLAASETATIVVQLQDSPDGSTGWANYGAASPAVVIADGADENGQLEYDVDLSAAKAFVRMVVTVTMSAGSIDTADVMGSFTFAGEHERPI